jgi:type IV secretion system protein VirD4
MRIEEDKLGQWDGAITLMLTQLIRTLERRKEVYGPHGSDKTLPPVLLLLDEFPRLGKVDEIENMISTLRSNGVTICIIVQSLAQLDKTYGMETRRIILDNCPYKAILNITDPESQKYFSDMIGSLELYSESISINPNIGQPNSITTSKSREPVIYPHEFASLDDDMVLIVPKGFCRVNKEPYYMNEEPLVSPEMNVRKPCIIPLK